MVIQDILDWLDESGRVYSFHGNRDSAVSGFSPLEHYRSGTLTWIKTQHGYEKAGSPSGIACAVIQDGILPECGAYIVSDDSKELFFSILQHFWGKAQPEGGTGAGTFISPEAEIAPTVSVGCGCTIDGEVHIGDHTVIGHNVVITGRVRIGTGCVIQSGVVIGIDGFGYSRDARTGEKRMIPHFGGVFIGDGVFIGSHVNIAKGTLDDTIIGSGTKIAPSTHIGHNTVLGENTTVICSDLFGSVRTGPESYIVASTVKNQSEIGGHTVIGMGSVVTGTVPENVVAYGIPAKVKKINDSGL